MVARSLVLTARAALLTLMVLLAAAPVARGDDASSSAVGATAAKVKGAAAAAQPAANAITFSEYSLGTTVTGQYQSRGVRFTSSVFISSDEAQPDTPALSGTPKFLGPIDGAFVIPGTATPTTVDGFTMDVGYIDNRNSVVIDYFDAGGNRLGSRVAQSYGINEMTIAVRGIASFSVHTVSYEAKGFTIDNLSIRTGADGIRPTRMAMLGDSYSSGEGLIPDASGLRYDCATDLDQGLFYRDTTMPANFLFWSTALDCDTRNGGSTARPGDLLTRGFATHENHCHRHGRAYPNQIRQSLGVAPENAIFVACSGAVTKNIGLTAQTPEAQWTKSPANVHGGHVQADDVAAWAGAGGNPDVVTVGIGGNDAEFTGIIIHCGVHDCVADWEWRDKTINRVNGTVYERLQDTFEKLRSRYPAATIFAFGYPSVVTEDKACTGVSLGKLGIQADERAWVADELIPTVNSAIEDAAALAGISYVDITAATAGHEICSDDAWINGLRGGTDKFNAVANESFHPNQYGHDAIARFFVDHYTDGGGQLIAGNPDPVSHIRPEPGEEIVLGTVDANAGRPCGADCLQPAACVQACVLHLQGDGFTPGVQLQGTLLPDAVRQSNIARRAGVAPPEGTPLVTVSVDAAGKFVADVPLPAGISLGDHAIEFTGTDVDGLDQSAIALFYVFETEPPPTRFDPPPAPAAVVPAPRPARASVKLLGWKGRKLYVRVSCPKTAPSACKVRLTLQVPGRSVKQKHKVRIIKPRTLRRVTVTVKAGKSRVAGLSRGSTKVSRKKLKLQVRTVTSSGTATATTSLKKAKTIRKVPKR